MQLILVVLLNTAGQLLLKAGTQGGSSLLLSLLKPWTLAGLLAYGLSTLLWLSVLRTYEVSRAYPAMASSYILVMIGGALLFREPLTLSKLAGAMVIMAGVFLTLR